MCNARDNMCNPCLLWDAVNVEFTRVCRHNFGSVGKIYRDWFYCWLQVFTGVPGRAKFSVESVSSIASVFSIFNTGVEYAVSVGMGLLLLVTIIYYYHRRLWQVWQIYCFYFVGWGKTSLHKSAIYCLIFIFRSYTCCP